MRKYLRYGLLIIGVVVCFMGLNGLLNGDTTYELTGETLEQYEDVVQTPPSEALPLVTTTTGPTPVVTTRLETIQTTTTTAAPNPAVVSAADPIAEYFSEQWWPITTESLDPLDGDPPKGAAFWGTLGGRFEQVGPGEIGLSKITSHLNPEDPHFNLVDDSSNDKHGVDDTGVSVGDAIWFALEDLQRCEYRVIEPLDTGNDEELEIKRIPIEGSDTDYQPAVYHPKAWASELRLKATRRWVDQTGNRSIVMLVASYGGPNGDEKNGVNRIYNAVVFAELVQCAPGEALEK